MAAAMPPCAHQLEPDRGAPAVMSSTRSPCPAAARVAASPARPEPTTMRSASSEGYIGLAPFVPGQLALPGADEGPGERVQFGRAAHPSPRGSLPDRHERARGEQRRERLLEIAGVQTQARGVKECRVP